MKQTLLHNLAPDGHVDAHALPMPSPKYKISAKPAVQPSADQWDPVHACSVDPILRSGVGLHENEDSDAFFVADLGEIERQYTQWTTLLPRVKPFYGIYPLRLW
jgi:hypothetical protein